MRGPLPAACSLYRRTLGEAFETLPPVLHRFHDRSFGGEACGTFRVTRGKGRIRQLAAGLMRLPPAGACIAVRLQVRVEGEREHWVRSFDKLNVKTVQQYRHGLLIETAGPFRFGFRVLADPYGMRFVQANCRLFLLPLPSFLTPQVAAGVQGKEEFWSVEVQVTAPLLGLLVRYEGEVKPLC